MRNIVLNDGTFIYSEDVLQEYLTSLGFDFYELQEALAGDVLEEEYNKGYQEAMKDSEAEVDGYLCATKNIANEIENVCDDFRKKYKSKAVLNVLDAIEKTVYNNRID